jgi:hypothetical protein
MKSRSEQYVYPANRAVAVMADGTRGEIMMLRRDGLVLLDLGYEVGAMAIVSVKDIRVV